MSVKIYSLFDPPPYSCPCSDEPSLTKQSFAADADINNIMARYAQTGYLVDPLSVPVRRPSFGDFSSVPDFHEAQEVLAKSYEHFDSLPAVVRDRFENDPVKLLDFLSDESNRDEAVRLGIVSMDSDVEASVSSSPEEVVS